MSKAEKFIQENTRNCSNVVAYSGMIEGSELRYHEWLTPDQARKAVEIAREEVVEDLSDNAKVSSGWNGFFYGQGYKQAEKDLELSWKDMFIIYHLVNEVLDDYAEGKTKKEVGEEVLKRFKESGGRG